MSDAERFELAGKEQVLIETYDVDTTGQIELVARSHDGALDFAQSVDRALPAARLLVEKLESLVSNVKTIEVEFGLKFAGEVGALIAKTGTEANFKIKLVWSPAKDSRS